MDSLDSITLKDLIKDKISELGDKAPTFFNVPAGMISQWAKDIKPPTLGAAEKVFAEYQSRQAQNNPVQAVKTLDLGVSTPTVTEPDAAPEPVEDKNTLVILMPLGKGFAPNIHTWETVERLKKKHKCTVIYDQGNPVNKARNILAHKAMEGGWKWWMWVDDDMFLQCGDPAHFNHYRTMCGLKPLDANVAGLDTIEQLRSHRAPIVSGIYYGRGVSHGALEANSQSNAQASQESRKWVGIRPTEWAGFGCMLTHRAAFEKILETSPNIRRAGTARQPHAWFAPELALDADAEDTAFCKRAKLAGMQVILDCSVRPGHIGSMIFEAENTKG